MSQNELKEDLSFRILQKIPVFAFFFSFFFSWSFFPKGRCAKREAVGGEGLQGLPEVL